MLDSFDCVRLLYQRSFAALVEQIRPSLPRLAALVCLDGEPASGLSFAAFTAGLPGGPWEARPVDDVAMIVGTGGTTGRRCRPRGSRRRSGASAR